VLAELYDRGGCAAMARSCGELARTMRRAHRSVTLEAGSADDWPVLRQAAEALMESMPYFRQEAAA
jgi:hypothetical protein